MRPRYLTKSKFKLAMECPTKLFYIDKPEFANLKSEDSFLMALAEGGFQVGELAKYYYPGGITIDTLDVEQAINETTQLLQQRQIIIFEAAIRYQNLFIRADILIKEDNHITLIEVKSKSIDSKDKSTFFNKTGSIKNDWKSYILDVAFQKFVLLNAFPDMRISSYLMLVDKNAECPTDGLNQKFRISKDKDNRVKIIVSNTISDEDLSHKILIKINIDNEINFIFNNERYRDTQTFSQYVFYLAENYCNDIKIKPKLGKICKTCEFKTPPNIIPNNLKSGFKECWKQECSLTEDDLNHPTVLDIWNLRKIDQLIEGGVFRPEQINEDDINPKHDGKPGWSSSERQWVQILKIKQKNNDIALDRENLKNELNSCVYPLHFIDFETTMTAIPFNKGEHPYQGLAFQFSHHLLHSNGDVEHFGQFLNNEIGKNPNLNFIRALKSDLENDKGTIFRYASHENTYLNMIYHQIKTSKELIEDSEQLLSFIKSISKSNIDSIEKWNGERNMVDLCELVKRFYFDPMTNGSNSIKHIFPAILNRSLFLKEKYGKPIYGAVNGIRSLNFKDWQWIKNINGKIVDPYTLLPKLFQDIDIEEEKIELLFNDDSLKEGGSASIAYARMQFSEMSAIERQELTQALLKYCELDTLAMVMIVEAWQDMLKD